MSWRPVQATLLKQSRSADVVDLSPRLLHGPGVYARLAEAVQAQLRDHDILVAHSGAGALLPSIVETCAERVGGAILVDGLMPHPGRSWLDTVPNSMAAGLRAASRDGLAPPWPRWLPRGMLAELLPDAAMRAELESSAGSVPLAFLGEPAPLESEWLPARSCAFLQLSAGYDDQAREARRLDWRILQLEADHLAILTRPDLIADAIITLATLLETA